MNHGSPPRPRLACLVKAASCRPLIWRAWNGVMSARGIIAPAGAMLASSTRAKLARDAITEITSGRAAGAKPNHDRHAPAPQPAWDRRKPANPCTATALTSWSPSSCTHRSRRSAGRFSMTACKAARLLSGAADLSAASLRFSVSAPRVAEQGIQFACAVAHRGIRMGGRAWPRARPSPPASRLAPALECVAQAANDISLECGVASGDARTSSALKPAWARSTSSASRRAMRAAPAGSAHGRRAQRAPAVIHPGEILDAVPQHEREIVIGSILRMCQQRGGDGGDILDREALQGRGERQAHRAGSLRLRQGDNAGPGWPR
jgi:hypothetical protein